jgi:hypothetical protein
MRKTVFVVGAGGSAGLYLQYAERDLAAWIERAVGFFHRRELGGPYTVIVSLTQTAGLTSQWDMHTSLGSRPRSPAENPLNLPPLVIESGSGEAIEPLLRLLWFAFGAERVIGQKPGAP